MGASKDGILGIENRTENWKTASYFANLSTRGRVALANRLGEPDDTPAEHIKIELFWSGVRDWVHCHGAPDLKEVQAIYRRLFDTEAMKLRQKISDFKAQPFGSLKRCNYMASEETQKDLYNNLRNTEIDIVLETPMHLFIGEAKHESKFGGDGKLILVHQLIRQYITATILLAIAGQDKCVVPFVVADEIDSVNNTAQVQFMAEQCWLKRENVLSWRDIDAIKEDALQGR